MEDQINLHDDAESFEALISLSGEAFGISSVLVEKDYWVTLALLNLSKSKHNKDAVFKGGTSLSKAHKVIHRFSEDIDLAVIAAPGANDNVIKRLLKDIEAVCTRGFNEIESDERQSKHGRFRKTIWSYPKVIQEGDYGDAGEHILLEVNSFTVPEQYSEMQVESLIAEYLKNTGKAEEVTRYHLEGFSVQVLRAERTFVEKVSALVKYSFLSPDGSYAELSKNIRHFYDLTKLMETCGKDVLSDPGKFKDLLVRVKQDDMNMDSRGEGWTKGAYKDAAVFTKFDEVWKKVSPAYRGLFKGMLYGSEKLPSEGKVKEAILAIAKGLESVE